MRRRQIYWLAKPTTNSLRTRLVRRFSTYWCWNTLAYIENMRMHTWRRLPKTWASYVHFELYILVPRDPSKIWEWDSINSDWRSLLRSFRLDRNFWARIQNNLQTTSKSIKWLRKEWKTKEEVFIRAGFSRYGHRGGVGCQQMLRCLDHASRRPGRGCWPAARSFWISCWCPIPEEEPFLRPHLVATNGIRAHPLPRVHLSSLQLRFSLASFSYLFISSPELARSLDRVTPRESSRPRADKYREYCRWDLLYFLLSWACEHLELVKKSD